MKSSQPSKIGRYQVVDRLGAGGMGVVYLATDPLLRRTVAIKVLPGQDDELRERFAREARSAASLRHHNVVTIFDIGEEEGQPFLAMEFLDGESMAELIRRQAPLTVNRRLQLMIELCAGLGYAHRSGIVHRDVKPGNLMITNEGTLKVLDFGLARITSEDTRTGLTRAGSILGTPHYMSPEQVHGRAVDPRSDIFSVGLVLYELLAYRKAYAGDIAHVVLHNIVHEAPLPLQEVMPDIDPDLARIVDKAIAKDPDDRYQSLAALAAELERVRVRHAEPSDTATLINARPRRGAGTPQPTSDEPTPARDARNRANLDVIARRRAAAVDSCVTTAAEHFAAGRYDEAITECEHAVLLNPQDNRAVELMARAHEALDDGRVHEWLAEARARMASGALTEAQALIDQSLMLRADSVEAQELRQQLRERRTSRESATERTRAATAALERATRSFEDGAFEAAARSASEVLAYDVENQDALDVRRRAAAAVEARRRQQGHDQWASDIVEQARLQTAADDPHGALELLESFEPPHPLVTIALARLRVRLSGGRSSDHEAEASRQPTITESAGAEIEPTLVAERPKPFRARAGQGQAPVATVDPPRRASYRGSAMMWAGPLAAIVLLSAGGIWFLAGDRATSVTTAPPSTDGNAQTAGTETPTMGTAPAPEPAVAVPDPGIESMHAAFRAAMGRDNLELAAATILDAPLELRQHPTLAADVNQLLAAAKRRASDAWAQAQKHPTAQKSATFLSAQARRTEATVLEREGQLPEAAQGFIAAAGLFARATPASQPAPLRPGTAAGRAEPLTAPVATAPVAAPPTVSTPVPVPPPAVSAPVTVTAPPAAGAVNPAPVLVSGPAPTPPSAPPAGAPVDVAAVDATAIREALNQYIAGYQRLDVGAIRRIYPGAPANLDLSNVRSYRLVLDNVEITLQGDKATVTAIRRVRAEMKAGKTQEPTLPTEFSMRRAGGGWVIERVR